MNAPKKANLHFRGASRKQITMKSLIAIVRLPFIVTALLLGFEASAVTLTLITKDTPAFYNGSIGTNLNDTSIAFPVNGDPNLDFTTPPDLSRAQSFLGNWLAATPSLPPQSWTPIPVQVPKQWPVGSETAIVYPLIVPNGGYTNLLMKFGVDNGIFVWFDGKFLGGHLRVGPAVLGEHLFAVTNVPAGTHYIQILREDHGFTDDYLVEVTAESHSSTLAANIYTAVEITWPSVQGTVYQLQSREDVTPELWQNFGVPITGDGTIMSEFDRTRDRKRRFYRVLQIQ